MKLHTAMALKLENITNYEKCGEILMSFNKTLRVYALKCVFCFQFNESLATFIEHIEQRHGVFLDSYANLLKKEENINKDCNRKCDAMVEYESIELQPESFSIETKPQIIDDPLSEFPQVWEHKTKEKNYIEVAKTTEIRKHETENSGCDNEPSVSRSSLNKKETGDIFEADFENESEFKPDGSLSLDSSQMSEGTNSKLKKKRLTKNQTKCKTTLSILQLSNEHNQQVIEIYKNFPCIWNTDHIDFRFKCQRQKAIGEMLKTIEEKIKIKLTVAELKKHLFSIRRACAQEKQKQFDCERLGDSYEPSYKFYQDIYFLSEHVGPFKCEYCTTIFKTVDKSRIHRSEHDGSMPFTCPICKRGFMNAHNCTTHIRRHMRNYDIECKICKKRFATTTELAVHERNHTGEMIFVCDTCGKCFRHRGQFDNHMRRHQNRPKHICELCEKPFYIKQKLKDHIKAHLNVRDQVCNICGKAFTSTKYLQQHKQIHSEKKKYVCKICTKEFAQYAGLSIHMKSHGTTISGTTLDEH